MAEALSAVKRELGPDALIVHTRAFKVGGMLGVGGREEVEILAAPVPAPATKPPITRPHKPVAFERAKAAYQAGAPAFAASAGVEPEAARVASAKPTAPERVSERVRVAPATQPAVRLALDGTPAGAASLHEELSVIKEMVSSLLAAGATPRRAEAATPGTDPLAAWYLRLLSSAVSRELAERIVEDVRRRTPAGTTDENVIRDAFRECIAAQIRTAPESMKLPKEGEPRPRTVAIVGATGVGKTTTIAKLAAHARLHSGVRAGIISCDTQRIGAAEQLRMYADIVGAAFRVAGSASEMAEARRALGEVDLLLIDTPGLSPRDAQGVAALAAMLDAADVDEVHLALPASGSEASLLGAARAFAPLRPSRLLFTKMDEAVTYGVLLSVAAEVRAELSYVTTGPRFPEQIERPDAVRLADLIAA